MSVAIVVVDNETGEVLARVASPDYFDERRAGQVDLTQAVRSPGSALKPFIYGLGFEDGLIHPESLIEDRPIRYAGYAPENFDLTFQGTVTVRRALQLSLNVPAVAVLDEVGPSRLIARLAEAGAPLVLPRQRSAGARARAWRRRRAGSPTSPCSMPGSRGRDGRRRSPSVSARRSLPPRRLIEPVAAWYVANVLLGTPPPENAAGGRIAFKTGTSYGYRDAWAIGFDGKRTIGVWVGRPDGAPVAGLVGRISAAPILFDAFARLGQPLQPLQARAERRARRHHGQAAAAAPALRFARQRRRGHGAEGADRVSAERREPRTWRASTARARPDRHQDRGRHPSPQRARERHAARRQEVGADAVLRARTGRASCGSP